MNNLIPDMTDEELHEFAKNHALLTGGNLRELTDRLKIMRAAGRHDAELSKEREEETADEKQILRLRGHSTKPQAL
jgi:hypothetical protein